MEPGVFIASRTGETQDRVDEDYTEQLKCVDSEFNDFTKKMSSFAVDQVWALYDDVDSMPRFYGQIKRITKSQSSLQVKWMEPKDENSVPVACGRFKWGIRETIKSHLTFSHQMHPIIIGRNFIAVNQRKRCTWALFRDWNKQHKPPYMYDFVEVLFDFDDQIGVGVAYFGKVQGFVSVFTQVTQHGVVAFMISHEEMNRFSHRVPSFRMIGNEKAGVPASSFELDPTVIPSSILKREHSVHYCGEVEDQAGSREDLPIILD